MMFCFYIYLLSSCCAGFDLTFSLGLGSRLASYPGPFTRAVRAGREIIGPGTSRSRMRRILLESW